MRIRRGTKSIFILEGIVCIAIMLVVFIERDRDINIRKDAIQDNALIINTDYSGLGNQQGAIQTGGSQLYFAGRGTIISCFGKNTYCFNESIQELDYFCSKRECLHIDRNCPAKKSLLFLQRYSSAVYGVPSNSFRNEIWKLQDNEIMSWYRADNDIYGLWIYGEYLYYTTEFGVFRILLEDPVKAEQIVDAPILYEYMTFYKNKIYFVTEDMFLYESNLDGSDQKRVVDEKALSPQICDDILYYKNADYDPGGVFQQTNVLKGISLKNGNIETVLDSVYRFSVVPEEKRIYYTELPDFSKSRMSFLTVLDIEDGVSRRITECLATTEIAVFPESNWIIYEMPEGDYDSYYCCIKKDCSERKELEYPKGIAE